ncbi:MAG: hypothetical protein DCC50_12645 [Acidobacteria bacterium]|nr:MAG: hypothetical protein DCC50_12645 [Acidobacteriota bacterium]
MSQHPDPDEPVTYSEDIDDLDLDAEQRARAEVDLDQPDSVDDVPWSPPEQRPMGAEMLELDVDVEETIDQRIHQEEPEEGTAYGAPESGAEARREAGEVDMLGGDDPDAIPAERDVLDGPE